MSIPLQTNLRLQSYFEIQKGWLNVPRYDVIIYDVQHFVLSKKCNRITSEAEKYLIKNCAMGFSKGEELLSVSWQFNHSSGSRTWISGSFFVSDVRERNKRLFLDVRELLYSSLFLLNLLFVVRLSWGRMHQEESFHSCLKIECNNNWLRENNATNVPHKFFERFCLMW